MLPNADDAEATHCVMPSYTQPLRRMVLYFFQNEGNVLFSVERGEWIEGTFFSHIVCSQEIDQNELNQNL